MERWLADIEGLFKEGLTGVHFESKQWAAITMNSGLQTAIVQQTSAVAGGLGNSDQDNLIGTEINAGTFQTLESKRTETIERGAYGSYNLLKFHIYENGLIVKEYQLGTRKPIQYEVVKEVEEEFDDGGFRELDGYFEGTNLAFVDYIQPRAIVQKGFKKMALAIIPGVKPSKYKGNLSVKKTPAVENKSKGTGKVSKRISDIPHVKEAKSVIAVRTKGLDLNEHPTTTKQMSSKKMKELRDKIDIRTITKQEYADYIWNKKFAKRRDKGVKEFWYQEQQRLLNNEPLTRDWSQEQLKDILAGKTPKFDGKPIAGHHSYSASKYPHISNKGEIIYPATFNEHLKGWHGGNWRNSNPGEPIIPIKDF
ncbi:hypothetical protein [Sporosarcina sp. E16_8]|uniref:hypothetical protein n=1 Tax=Sporosarcina sp. E16_8 TaxID=2789295 RepID=UPI0021040F70|nr:hypothetical protein [Sporosarcina sp. E16_8]